MKNLLTSIVRSTVNFVTAKSFDLFCSIFTSYGYYMQEGKFILIFIPDERLNILYDKIVKKDHYISQLEKRLDNADNSIDDLNIDNGHLYIYINDLQVLLTNNHIEFPSYEDSRFLGLIDNEYSDCDYRDGDLWERLLEENPVSIEDCF